MKRSLSTFEPVRMLSGRLVQLKAVRLLLDLWQTIQSIPKTG